MVLGGAPEGWFLMSTHIGYVSWMVYLLMTTVTLHGLVGGFVNDLKEVHAWRFRTVEGKTRAGRDDFSIDYKLVGPEYAFAMTGYLDEKTFAHEPLAFMDMATCERPSISLRSAPQWLVPCGRGWS
jgi:hypothetical protein